MVLIQIFWWIAGVLIFLTHYIFPLYLSIFLLDLLFSFVVNFLCCCWCILWLIASTNYFLCGEFLSEIILAYFVHQKVWVLRKIFLQRIFINNVVFGTERFTKKDIRTNQSFDFGKTQGKKSGQTNIRISARREGKQ